ncbi:hypothetical protein JTE90_019538 [Oedothorax gibbosus]|uniref:Uncharacterized protein n=1 Tax=Oedothorax gibbosus TaxID=931172 RepID=A0AAV6U886_9ARAC|nr:hypothetical protein JTE90_019538 [Oedothorax gibbosus]
MKIHLDAKLQSVIFAIQSSPATTLQYREDPISPKLFIFPNLNMEENRSDSEEEDLEALRLAALATLKSRTANKSDPESPETGLRDSPNPVIQTALHPRKEPSSANPYAWRNNAAQPRRGRGRGGFPKMNQRSNLIVITPVGAENEFTDKRETPAPQLLLPQHKWCQAANENSSSPKTFSKRGPTRFNRHESGSESSDSDYDDISEQDSYSNETILQDENSMTFQDERIDRESTPVTDEVDDNYRLNFPIATNNSASDLNEPSKYSSYQYKSQQVPFPGTSTYQNEIVPVNGGSKQDFDGRRLSESNPEGYSSANFVDPNLSQSDLRLELKRRMLKLRRESAEASKPESSSDKPVRDRTRTSEDSARGYSLDQNRTHEQSGLQTATHSRTRNRSRSLSRGRNRSRSLSRGHNRTRSRSLSRGNNRSRSRSLNRSRNRSRSLSSSRNRSRSRSPRHPNRQRSSSRERNSKRYDRYSKRDHSDTPDQKRNRGSTKSPKRNGNHSWSRSPVKTHQRISASPTKNNKRVLSLEKKKLSHSPVKSNKHDYIWSPEINKKDNCIQSPQKSLEKSRSRSPDRGRSRKNTPTPEQGHTHLTRDSPERTRKRHHSRSPERKTKHNHSPDSKNHAHTRKPVRGHKRISPPRSSNASKSSRSPYKNRKRSSTRSPNRTSNVRRRSRSPVRSRKSNPSRSPNRSRKQSPPSALEQKHKPNAKHSPHRDQEPRHKHNLTQCPEQVLKSISSPQRHLEQKLQHRISPSPKKIHSNRSPGRDHWRDSSSSSERSDRDWRGKKNTSRRWSRSSSANSSDSSQGHSSRLKSISSVVKPVLSSVSAVSSVGSKDDRLFNSDYLKSEKNTIVIEEKPKALMSLVKSSVIVGENRNNAPDMGKRLPVHMRLGKLPRNKLIRMAKDVEAAFVNSSSDENGETDAEGRIIGDHCSRCYIFK